MGLTWKTQNEHVRRFGGSQNEEERCFRIRQKRFGMDRRIAEGMVFDRVLCCCDGTSRAIQSCMRDIESLKEENPNSRETRLREKCCQKGKLAVDLEFPG